LAKTAVIFSARREDNGRAARHIGRQIIRGACKLQQAGKRRLLTAIRRAFGNQPNLGLRSFGQ
jgi:hypothetical protein